MEENRKSALQVWEEFDQNHRHNTKFQGQEGFTGLFEGRKCTDLVFGVVFLVFNLGLLYPIWLGVTEGSIDKLSKGNDFRGDSCGVEGLDNRPYLYWPDPHFTQFAVCIEECPIYYIEDYICLYDSDHLGFLTDLGCWDTIESTTYGFYCLPFFEKARKNVTEYLFEHMVYFKRLLGDLFIGWEVCLVGMVGFIALGLLFFLCFGSPRLMTALVLLSMAAVEGLLLYFAHLFSVSYERTHSDLCEQSGRVVPEYCYESYSNVFFGLRIAMYGLAFVFAVYLIIKRNKVRIGVAILRMTCEPLEALKRFFLFVVLYFLALLGLVAGVVYLLGLTMSRSSGREVEYEGLGQVKHFEYSTFDKALLVFVVFVGLWWAEFLLALGKCVFEGGASIWYFNKDRNISYSPLLKSLGTVFRYHLGSLALVSLVNLTLKCPITLFGLLVRVLEKTVYKCKACIWCSLFYKKWLRYFQETHYALLVISGCSYFQAAQKSYFLSQRNPNTKVPSDSGKFVTLVIKSAVSLCAGAITYSLLLFHRKTLLGESTQDITCFSEVALVSFLVYTYLSEMYVGCMESSMKAVIASASCDEEMFERVHKFIDFAFVSSFENSLPQRTQKVVPDSSMDSSMNDLMPNRTNRSPTFSEDPFESGSVSARPNMYYRRRHSIDEVSADGTRPAF